MGFKLQSEPTIRLLGALDNSITDALNEREIERETDRQRESYVTFLLNSWQIKRKYYKNKSLRGLNAW